MVESLIAVLVAAVVVAGLRRLWRGRRAASSAGAVPSAGEEPSPDPGTIRRPPTRPADDRADSGVATARSKGLDATEEGNRIWEEAMADWADGDYDAAADGFGWAETQYSAAADLFERAPGTSSAIWQSGDDDDGPQRAALSYEAAAEQMRLAAERAAEGDEEAATEHVESAREELAGTSAGPTDGPVD